jgi:hypothetical protein
MAYEYAIATLDEGIGGLRTLFELGIPYPADEPLPYSVEIPLGDGGIAGQGWPVVRWHWNIIRVVHWNILRTYCPNKSSNVFIRTYDVNENQQWANYKAKMIFPTSRPFSAGRVVDFTVLFQALEEA